MSPMIFEKALSMSRNVARARGGAIEEFSIHVVDLALGHLRALERIDELPGVTTLNLGTGRGYSVLEMVRAFEAASGRPVPYDIVARRPGDIAACWADPARAEQVLGWKAQRDLQAMCVDAWRWQSGNPQGYEAG